MDNEGRPIFLDSEAKRVAACARFYAALHVTPAPVQHRRQNAGAKTAATPFPICSVWTLLASIVRLKPRYQLTAIVLVEVIKVSCDVLLSLFTYSINFGNFFICELFWLN